MENSAVDIIYRWDSDEASDKFIFNGDRQEVERYLQAVDEIQRSQDYGVIQMAMERLELEFRNIFVSHTNPLKIEVVEEEKQEQELQIRSCSCFGRFHFHASSPASPKRHHNDDDEDRLLRFDRDYNSIYGLTGAVPCAEPVSFERNSSISENCVIPYYAINDLRCIAERMISSGYMCQCIEVYATVRKSVVDDTLRRLGIDDDVRWEQLGVEAKIQRWTEASKVCFKTLFGNEKKLCEQIFDGVETSIAEACFMETVKAPAIQLLNFVDTACITLSSSPDNLFKILDLYEVLADLMPDIELVFDSEFVRVMAAQVLSQLAEATRGALSLFENVLLGDLSKVVVPDGGIHPLTTYVMNYLSLISESDYKNILNELIQSRPSFTLDVYFADTEEEVKERNPLDMHLIWVIQTLQFSLDDNSKRCKDEPLSHLFIVNNVHHILERVRASSGLMHVTGDDYLKKLIQRIRRDATSYERASWGRVLNCLTFKGLSRSNIQIIRRTKRFNAMFENVHRTQAVWFIPDPQLREDLQLSIIQKLIPAYRTWLGLCGIWRKGRTGYYFKYSVEDLNNAVFNFFQGIPVSQH
ncbi:hypothetical protein RJT34_17041 [Clitoria ternatea]|uniref:Exocyst subunit Exo70 family protein n=1 Tax=Clitoria ternatea TaxID=43366 RepID=A0AAN9J8K1_CLITE